MAMITTGQSRTALAAAVMVVSLVAGSATVLASPPSRLSPTEGALTGRILVSLRYRPHAARSASVGALLARSRGRIAGPVVPEIGLLTLRPPAGVSAAAFASRLRSTDPAVRSAQPERRFSLRALPNDPALAAPETGASAPAGTTVQWWATRQDLPRGWDISRGAGAVVAVIDTGIDGGHPELSGRIVAATSADATVGHGPATSDESGHGTHVASLACAASNNGIGLAGAGLDCGLLVEKSDLSDASVAQSIVDATDRHADAINMSFGTDGSQPAATAVVDAVNYAYAHNVVMVAAAADSAAAGQRVNEQGDPANLLQPTGTGADLSQGRGLSVTSANFAGQRAAFAGSGSQISMAAYGTFLEGRQPAGIFGAFPGTPTSIDTGSVGPPPQAPCTSCRTTFGGDNRYAYLQGTSMSTPMVSAVGAVIHHLNRELTAGEIVRILKQTAQRPPGAGWSPELGWGILDGGAALDAARRVDRRAPVSRLTAPRTSRSRRVRLRWSGSDPAAPGLIASGIDHFELWRAVSRGRPVRIAITSATSRTVRVRPGRVYTFFTLAVDRAGNRESAPTHRAVTRVSRRA